jgi:hypothetical protein
MDSKLMAVIGGVISLLFVLVGCGAVHDELPTDVTAVDRITGLPTRIAILRSKLEDPAIRYDAMFESAYGRLEWQTGEILRRSKNVIIERRDLRSIREEQWWQYQPEVSENAAAPLGQLLGAKLLFLYKITAPSYRERFFNHGAGPQITVTAKVLRVETGEVVWSHMTAAQMPPQKFDGSDEYTRALQAALNQAVDAMLTVVGAAVVMSNSQQ